MSYSKKEVMEAFSTKYLHLTILPTEQCNFRCVYCYEDFLLGEMSTETIQNVKDLLTERAPFLDKLILSFFGGEPLLAKDVILTILEHVSYLQKTYQFKVSGSVTTNASLLSTPLLRKLCGYGIKSYQISLDGMPEYHNKTRITQNSNGTFDIIWKRLKSAYYSDIDFVFTLRLHVTSENKESILVLCNHIDDNFKNDKRFKKFIRGISNLKSLNGTYKDNDDNTQLYPVDTISEELKGRSDVILQSSEYICYAAKPNSFVIRSNGDISKCTVNFNKEENKIGKLLSKGNMSLNEEKVLLWSDAFRYGGDRLACPAHHVSKKYHKEIDIVELT